MPTTASPPPPLISYLEAALDLRKTVVNTNTTTSAYQHRCSLFCLQDWFKEVTLHSAVPAFTCRSCKKTRASPCSSRCWALLFWKLTVLFLRSWTLGTFGIWPFGRQQVWTCFGPSTQEVSGKASCGLPCLQSICFRRTATVLEC